MTLLLARLCASRDLRWARTVQNRARDDIDSASEGCARCRGASTLSHRLRTPLNSVRSIFCVAGLVGMGGHFERSTRASFSSVQYPLGDPPNFESRPVARKGSGTRLLSWVWGLGT